jgi:predicted nucleic acid-binding protein
MTVVDASVAAKWYLPESGSQEAARLLRSPEALFAPALIRIEVTAAILRQFRNNAISESRAEAACDEWLRALAEETLTLIPDEELFPEAMKLARRLRHPFQDCLYLACANQLHVPLVTADPKFHKRSAELFPAVALLSGAQAN